MTIIIIILLAFATRGIFAVIDDLKKVVWIEWDDKPRKWNSFTGYENEKEQIKETLDRR